MKRKIISIGITSCFLLTTLCFAVSAVIIETNEKDMLIMENLGDTTRTISGYVYDSKDSNLIQKEYISDVTVEWYNGIPPFVSNIIDDTTTNDNGFWDLSVEVPDQGVTTIHLKFSHPDYKPNYRDVHISENSNELPLWVPLTKKSDSNREKSRSLNMHLSENLLFAKIPLLLDLLNINPNLR